MIYNKETIEKVVALVMQELDAPLVEIEASGRHCHLSRQAIDALFGDGYQLTPASPLSQPGQFACKERVALKGEKGEFASVIVLGPQRPETQVEISATDILAVGIKAPLRMSGKIEGTPGATLAGPKGEYVLGKGVIVAARHIHMHPDDAKRYGFTDGQEVDVEVNSPRGITFHKVTLRVSADFKTFMHIDYDEANACGFEKGMRGRIVVPKAKG